jgi:phosphoglucomutase
MEKISSTDHVRKKQGLYRVREQRNILQTIKRRKANWTGHSLHWNCLYNTLLRERYREGQKWREDEDEDVSSYWMTLRKRGDPRN